MTPSSQGTVSSPHLTPRTGAAADAPLCFQLPKRKGPWSGELGVHLSQCCWRSFWAGVVHRPGGYGIACLAFALGGQCEWDGSCVLVQSSARHKNGEEGTSFGPNRLPGWCMAALAAPMLECFAAQGAAVPV